MHAGVTSVHFNVICEQFQYGWESALLFSTYAEEIPILAPAEQKQLVMEVEAGC